MKAQREIRRHKAVTVHVGKEREKIDVMLAPLIREIWKAGIQTMMSCQETEPGIAWIDFDSLEDLRHWLNIVAEYEEGADTLYNRINYRLTGTITAPLWQYQINLLDCGFNPADDGYEGPPDFVFDFGVYFPHIDLPVLLQRMKRHNRLWKARSRLHLPIRK